MSYQNLTVGWREWVGMPALGLEWTKAKVDTGARSSSLHAVDLETFERNGMTVARFSLHPWQSSDIDSIETEAAVVDHRIIRSSNGEEQLRPVIRTEIVLGEQSRHIEVTLTRRDNMGFRMLLGREALRQHILVDPRRSYRLGRPPKVVRQRNRATA